MKKNTFILCASGSQFTCAPHSIHRACAYVNHVRGRKYLLRMLWRAWLAPSPSPPSPLGSERGEGGELLKGHVLPGNCERGGGLHWRVYLAGINGDSIGRTKVATLFGGPKWRLFLADQNVAGLLGSSMWGLWRAGQFGESIQRVLLKGKQGFNSRKAKQ